MIQKQNNIHANRSRPALLVQIRFISWILIWNVKPMFDLFFDIKAEYTRNSSLQTGERTEDFINKFGRNEQMPSSKTTRIGDWFFHYNSAPAHAAVSVHHFLTNTKKAIL